MTTGSYRKDVSDAEIRSVMESRLAPLIANVVLPAQARSPSQDTSKRPKEENRATTPTHASSSSAPNLTEDERAFLESACDEPLLSVTQRRDKLGLSTDAATALRKRLHDRVLIENVAVNLGQRFGGRVVFVELTAAGFEALGREMPVTRRENVSAEHWWWQSRLASYYLSKGLRAEIEHCLGGKRADVAVFKNGSVLAIEVELSPNNAAVNALRDLEVGFSKVLVGARNANVLKAVREKLDSAVPAELRSRVILKTLPEFSFVAALKR